MVSLRSMDCKREYEAPTELAMSWFGGPSLASTSRLPQVQAKQDALGL